MDSTLLPTTTASKYFYWPSCELRRPLTASTSDTTIYWTVVPRDEDGVALTGGFLIGVTNRDGKTELMWVAVGAVSADGLSATVVRGIDIMGSDYTAGSSDFVYAIESGSPVFCAISPNIQELIVKAIQGGVGTGANLIKVGDETDSDIYYYANNADGSKPYIRYKASTNQWEISNDGTSSFVPGTGAGAITGGDGISVTSGDIDVDLTDTTIFVQSSSGAADAGKVARLSAGTGKLATGFITAAPFTTYISDAAALVGGPTSNADALHTHESAGVSVTAGEAVNGSSTTVPISLLGNNFKKGLFINATGVTFFDVIAGANQNFGDVDASTWATQSFTVTDALATAITLESITVELAKVLAPTDNVTISIQADSSGVPSGTTITNGTSANITGGSLSTSMLPVKFTWATPPTLTSGTKYWAVFKRSTANNAANYYQLRTAGADTLASHDSGTYTSSTLTWSTSTTDFQMFMQFNMDYDGKGVYADCNTFPRAKFSGFTQSNVSAAASMTLVADGVIDGFTGLSSGADYWLSATQAQITTTLPSRSTTYGAASPIVNVGRAINTTSIAIDKRYSHVLEVSSVYTSGAPWIENGVGAATATCDIFIETGFSPRKFFVRFTQSDVAGTAADDRYNVEEFRETTQVMNFTMSATSLSPASAASSIAATANDYVSIQAIYENGYLLRIQQKHDDESLNSLAVIAEY